jgi:hypothetical protein
MICLHSPYPEAPTKQLALEHLDKRSRKKFLSARRLARAPGLLGADEQTAELDLGISLMSEPIKSRAGPAAVRRTSAVRDRQT